MKTQHLLAAALGIAATAALHAAPITWGPATAVGIAPGNSSDVSLNGTPVEAFNGQADDKAPNSPVVNGVTFVGTKTLLLDASPRNLGSADMSSGTNGGDPSYDALLSDLDYGGNGATATISIGGGSLTIGASYEVQIWFVDDRTTTNARVMRYGDGEATQSTVDLNDQFSIGAFTADGTSQTISLAAQGFGRAHITAYQLRFTPTNPVVTLSTIADPVTTAYTVDVVFNEDITGLEDSDFVVSNGTASGVAPASGPASVYTVTITPTASGPVTVDLPADSVIDADTNGNLASNSLLTTYTPPGSDTPSVTLSTTASSPVYDPYTVTVTFSEDVTGLTASDFTVLNGTASGVSPASGPATLYTVTITPIADGDVTVTLPANSVTDNDGDNLMNTASNSLVTAFLTPSIPTAILYNPLSGPIVTGPYTVEIDFSEPVNGLQDSDFTVTNGTASMVDPANGPQMFYTVLITPTTPGLVSVVLNAASVLDDDGEGQTNPESNTLRANFIAPGTFTSGAIDLSGRDVLGLGTGESNGFFPSPKIFGPTTDFSMNDIPWSDGGESGTFDVSIVATGSKTNIKRGGKGAFGTVTLTGEAALIAPGDSITLDSVVISDLKGDLAGRTIADIRILAVYLGNRTAGDGATINNQTATGGAGGDTTEAMRNDIEPTTSALVLGTGTGNGYSLNGIDLSFTAEITPPDPKVVSSGFNGSDEFVITFSGLDPGVTYELRWSPDLLTAFTPVPNTAKMPAGTTDSFTDPAPPLPGPAFYRLWTAP